MAQNQRRMIYTKIWTSEQFSKLSDKAKLLYIGTITLADDDGRLIGNPAYLRGQIFTYDDIQIVEVIKIRSEVEKIGLITVYKVKDSEYIQHPNWLKYQIIRGDLYTKSSLPTRNGTVTEPLPKRDTSKDKISKDKIRGCGGKKDKDLPEDLTKKFMYYYDQEVKEARKNRYKTKITQEAKSMLIAVGFLWEKMAKVELGEKEVPMKNIYFPIRQCWDKNPDWKYDDFKNLFTHFLNSKIPQEDKISFDLCLSEKYVAKYKIAKKNKKESFAGIANEIKL